MVLTLHKSRKKRKGSAPIYGVSGMKVDKPHEYTFAKAKERKLKHIWEGTKDKGVYLVKDQLWIRSI